MFLQRPRKAVSRSIDCRGPQDLATIRAGSVGLQLQHGVNRLHEHFNLGDWLARTAVRPPSPQRPQPCSITGAAWRGLSAAPQTCREDAARQTAATDAHRACDRGRRAIRMPTSSTSPRSAVVHSTSSGKGKATESPAELQSPNDDFFRRFFGDPGDDPHGQGQERMPRRFRQSALGSGVIVSSDGYILTNFHVVDGADNIKVELTDGRTIAAKLVGTDKPSDLAVLEINASESAPDRRGSATPRACRWVTSCWRSATRWASARR